MSQRAVVELRLNGRRVRWDVSATTTLLDALRQAGLTGAKEGCGIGECGSCTVLVNSLPTVACLVLAAELSGASVTTIESKNDRRIEQLRKAFLDEGALQCGACTPGMIMAASRIPRGANDDDIRQALIGNVCRCTGYSSIVRAVQRAHRKDSGE